MKKNILYFIIAILFSLSFSNKIEASYCMYSSKNKDTNFYTMDVVGTNGVWVRNMGTSYLTTDSTKIKVAKTASEKERKLTAKDECFKYMFYSSKEYDKLYFSNDLSVETPKGYKVLFLEGPYTGMTNANVKLNKMVCSYAGTIDKNQLYWTINFVIDNNGYTVYGNGEKLYSIKNGNINSLDEYKLEDNYDIRLFRSSDSKYGCPSGIFLEYGKTIGLFKDKYHTILKYNGVLEKYPDLLDRLSGQTTGTNYLSLQKSASFIDSEEISGNISSDCLFSRQDNTSSWDLGVHSITYSNGNVNYEATLNKENISTNINKTYYIFNSDDYFTDGCKLTKIYTNCLTSETGICTISDRRFDLLQQSEGVVETLINSADRNDKNYEDAQEGVSVISGYKYKEFMCKLSEQLNYIPSAVTKLTNDGEKSKLVFYNDSESNVDGKYMINDLPCTKWGFRESIFNCNDQYCKDNIDYITQSHVMDIFNYCDSIYNGDFSNEELAARESECLDFRNFYNQMVKYGILKDLTSGCDFVSSDLQEKLTWILDLIKIAGPILALGLGTLDFIKAIASGDADKEMKTAFKRFSTRLISAALLFIIPFILAFLMDTFLGNQEGYNEDNPFCNVVEWK